MHKVTVREVLSSPVFRAALRSVGLTEKEITAYFEELERKKDA